MRSLGDLLAAGDPSVISAMADPPELNLAGPRAAVPIRRVEPVVALLSLVDVAVAAEVRDVLDAARLAQGHVEGAGPALGDRAVVGAPVFEGREEVVALLPQAGLELAVFAVGRQQLAGAPCSGEAAPPPLLNRAAGAAAVPRGGVAVVAQLPGLDLAVPADHWRELRADGLLAEPGSARPPEDDPAADAALRDGVALLGVVGLEFVVAAGIERRADRGLALDPGAAVAPLDHAGAAAAVAALGPVVAVLAHLHDGVAALGHDGPAERVADCRPGRLAVLAELDQAVAAFVADGGLPRAGVAICRLAAEAVRFERVVAALAGVQDRVPADGRLLAEGSGADDPNAVVELLHHAESAACVAPIVAGLVAVPNRIPADLSSANGDLAGQKAAVEACLEDAGG